MEKQENIDILSTEDVSVAQTKDVKKEKKISLEMRLIGWAGSIMIITAYSLNSLGYIDSQNILYPLLNLVGSFFMGIRIWAARNWSNFFLEIFWAAIAVVSIIKFFIT